MKSNAFMRSSNATIFFLLLHFKIRLDRVFITAVEVDFFLAKPNYHVVCCYFLQMISSDYNSFSRSFANIINIFANIFNIGLQ